MRPSASVEQLISRGIDKFNRSLAAEAVADFTAAVNAAPQNAAARHFRALALLQAGRRDASWSDMKAALSLSPRSAEIRLSAARLLESLGRPKEALEQGRRARALDPGSEAAASLCARLGRTLGVPAPKAAALPDPRRTRAETARALKAAGFKAGTWQADALSGSLSLSAGLIKEARAAAARLRRSSDRSAARRLAAAGLLWDLGELGPALEQAASAAAAEPKNAPALRRLCEMQVAASLRMEALQTLPKAVSLSPKDEATQLWAASICRTVGEFALAEGHLRRAASLAPRSAKPRLELGELSLWRGRAAEAGRHALAALELGGHEAAARRLLGASFTLSGRLPQARRELNAALKLSPSDAEALVWRAEAARRGRRLAAAAADLDAAEALGTRSLGLLINRALVRRALKRPVSPQEYDEIYGLVPWRQLSMDGAGWPSTALLERLLSLMRGNRGPAQTYGWTARDREVHYEPRFTLMELQGFLRFGDAARVLREFDRLVARDPQDSYRVSSRGEVLLWLGRYDAAAADLKRSLKLDPRSPWPNVGLCATEALRGRYDRALAHLDAAAANRASEQVLLTWRGEILRRQGRPREALKVFAEAAIKPPFRPSLWLNVALARGAAGDRAGQRDLLTLLRRHLPLFLADAAHEARSRRDDAVLSRALDMMRGNRSSWMYTYLKRSGDLKHAALSGIAPRDIPPALSNSRWIFSSYPQSLAS